MPSAKDLNPFKPIHDTYGHPAGDPTLRDPIETLGRFVDQRPVLPNGRR